MITIAIANQKGGVGKTASAVSLSGALAMAGRRVLLCDLDAQASATLWLMDSYGEEGRAAYDVLMRAAPVRGAIVSTAAGFDLLPSNLRLGDLESDLLNAVARERRLHTALREIEGSYDVCFVDCSPNLGLGTQNAVAAAEVCIIPIDCRPQALVAVPSLVNLLFEIEQEYQSPIQALALPTFYERTNVAKGVLEQVQDKFESLTLPIVHKNTRLVEAWMARETIYQYDKTCPAAVDYLRVARELETELETRREAQKRTRRTK